MATAASSSSVSDAKRHVTADELLRLSELLARKVVDAGFRPTFLIAVWRGGCLPGMVVQEFLERYYHCRIDHVSSRTASRDPVSGEALPEIQVYAIGHACAVLSPDDRLLIVDDVWDSGRSVPALIAKLETRLRHNMPREVRVATVFYKPERNKSTRVPDFYVESSAEWLVFPHELQGLSDAELAQHRPHAHALLSPHV